MGEFFGIAAGALGLLGVIDASLSIGGKVLEYAKDFRDETDEHRRLLSELSVLQSILPLLRHKLEDAKRSDNSVYATAAKALEVPDGPLDQYRLSIERISNELEKARIGSTTAQAAPSSTQSPVYTKRPWWKKATLGKTKRSTPPASSSVPTPVPSKTSPNLFRRLAWPSTLDDIEKDLERVERFQASVILVLTAGAPAAKFVSRDQSETT